MAKRGVTERLDVLEGLLEKNEVVERLDALEESLSNWKWFSLGLTLIIVVLGYFTFWRSTLVLGDEDGEHLVLDKAGLVIKKDDSDTRVRLGEDGLLVNSISKDGKPLTTSRVTSSEFRTEAGESYSHVSPFSVFTLPPREPSDAAEPTPQ